MRDIFSLINHFTFLLNVLNFVVLAYFILGCTTLSTPDNTYRDDDTENTPQGYFTRGITNYHLVHPVKILENGKRVTKLVSHFYEDDLTSEGRRKKREIIQHHELHYDVPLNSGKTLRLVLSPNHDLLTPGLIVEHKNSESQFNVGKTRIRRASTRRCYYKGKILNDPKSEVAISTCRGLAGFIRSNEGDYFIEPSLNYDPNDESHPHIVFRKGSDTYGNGNIHSGSRSSNCATKGNPTKLNKEDDVEEEADDNLEDTEGNDEYRQQQRRYHSPKLEPVESIEGDDEEDDYEDEGEAEIDDEEGEGMEDNENQIYSREEIEKCREVYKNNSYTKSGKNKCPNNNNNNNNNSNNNNRYYDEDKKCAQTPTQKNKEDQTEDEDKEDEDEEEVPRTTQLSTTSKNSKKRKKNKDKHTNPVSKEETDTTSTIQQLFPKHKKFKISSTFDAAPNNNTNNNNKNLVTKCKLNNNCKNNNNECCLDLVNNNTISTNDNNNMNSDYDEYNNNNNIKFANTNKRFKKFKAINNHQRNNNNYNQNFKLHNNKKMKNYYYHGKPKENYNNIINNNNDNEVYEVNTNDIANGIYDKPMNLKLTSKDVKRKHKISNLKSFYTNNNNNNNNNRIHQKYSQIKRSRSKLKHDDYPQRSGGSRFDGNDNDGLVIDFNPAVHFSSLIGDNDNDAFRITNSSSNDTDEYNGSPFNDSSQFKNESMNEEERKRKREIEYQSCKLPEVCKNHTECIWDLRLTIVISYLFSQRHKDIDIETYVLTVVNMISRNFQDDSLGLLLNVKIVRMVFIEYRMDELDEDKNKLEELFENFCLFQYRINPFHNKHPNHHDMGIYLISSTICSLNAVYGVASQSSVCNCQKTCIVAYDEGLLLGNILTHQLGHSLGAEHDLKGVEQYCDSTGRLMYNHMSAMISLNASQWSKCSAQAIRRFVRGPGSRCLRHLTVDLEFDWPVHVLAGQIYNPVQQCSLNFHMPMLPCYTGDFCRFLYCQVNENQCVSRLVPPAEGTICAADMWCIGGYCVTEGRFPNRVNGEWNSWGQWSPCTRSCGGGVQFSDRLCNNPPPKGGRYCPGKSRRHRICMTENCAPRAMSFRDLQCRETEDIPFRGMVFSWVAFFTNYEYVECSLVCESESGVVAVREMVVKDGTTCKPGTKNVCISGSCVDVGCDWGINSGAVADACGICHGNGTECKIIQGLYTERNNSGYVPFMKVPKGSGMIYARELNPSDVHLVVSSFNQGIFYLNGPESILVNVPMTGEVDFGSSRGMYNSMGRMERVFIQGPTDEDLIFFVKFNSDLNEGIRYQFAMPEVDPNYIPTYSWQFIDWEECSDACGGGQQFSRPKCVEDKGGIVEDMYCQGMTKPKDVVRSCNEFPCLPRWWVGSWSECLTIGNEEVRYRSVLCMRTRDANSLRNEILKDKFCCDEEKPESVRRCNETWMKCQEKTFKCDFDTGHAKFADFDPIFNLEELNVRFTDDDSIKDEVNDARNKIQALEDGDYVEDVNYDDMLDADLGKQGLNDISREDAKKFIKYLKDAENSPTIITKETKGELKETESKKTHGTKSLKSQSINQRNKQSKIVKDNTTTVEDSSNNTDYEVMSAPRKYQLKKLHEGESQHNKPILVQSNKMKVSKLEREGLVGSHTGMNYTNVSVPNGGFTLPNLNLGKSNVVLKSSGCNRPTTCPPKAVTTCSEKTFICNVTECDLPLKCPPASAPLKTVLDQIILSEFKLSVIPVMCEQIRYRPNDHDYETFHETTSWAVGQDKNRTILVGQKALLFLLQARKNMTRVPFIFHAEN